MPASDTPIRAMLSSKLSPPTSRSVQIPRVTVHEQVRTATAARLVLVRAPAGFGKTTAMIQCRAQFEAEGTATAWLTLDEADNDVARFLWCLEAAVARLPHAADPISDYAEGDRSSGHAALDLVARLAGDHAAFALFLDDFERLQEPAVVGLVREIIDHLPRRGQLVIGSRSLPDLGLGRLRARGQLLEIGPDQLRFSVEETADFLVTRRQLLLSQADLLEIHQKAEGWVTALWLASLALEQHAAPADFVARFSGADHAIADYLVEDVLSQQPREVREFLLRTSVLRHLSAELCNALLPDTDSAALLHRLDAANIFLTPIDSQETTYRYHSLFADFLRSRLQRDMPAEIPRLHLAASSWYAAQGRPVPAIDHALAGQDFARALQLLEQHAGRLLSQGRMRLLARWFDRLPADRLQDHPALQPIYIWAVCFTRGPHATMELLQRTGLEQSAEPPVRSHVLAIRPLLLAIMDRFEEAHASGQTGLAQLPTSAPFADMALVNAMANVYSVMGEYQQARQLLDDARDTQGAHESAFNVMYSESVEGIIDLQEGRQRQAAARFRLALEATRRATSFNHTNGNAWAGILHAATVYEANQLSQAARLLHVYVPLAKDVGLADHMILGDVMLSRIAFQEGDIDRSFQILTGLEHMGHARQLPRVVASARLERARLLLLQGHAQSARSELNRADDQTLWPRLAELRLAANDLEYLELGRLRWEVLAGNSQHAATRLGQAAREAAAGARHRRALKLRILLAIALHRSGVIGDALYTLQQALQEACTERYVRLIVDEGPAAGALILLLQQELQRGKRQEHDPLFIEYIADLIDAFGPLPIESVTAANPPDSLLESLTRKEIQVLQLLAEGYSNSAMAEKLFVSDSTVRTHLRNINAKLDASSRTQAVAIARRLGVIG